MIWWCIIILHYIERIFFILTIVFIPFQDCGLRVISGYLGQFLSNIPMLFLFFTVSVKCFFCKFVYYKLLCKAIVVLTYISLVSVIPIFAFYYDTFIFDTLLRNFFVNYCITISKLFMLVYIIKKFQYKDRLYIKVAFIICFMGFLLCDVFEINIGGAFLHYSISINGRPKGFSSESSFLGYTIIILGFLSAAYSDLLSRKILYISMAVAVLIFSTSKGALFTFFVIICWYFWRIFSKKYIRLLFAIFIAGMVYSFGNIVFSYLTGTMDMYSTMSFTTRSSCMLAAILVFLDYPLGCGLGVFSVEALDHLPQAYDMINTFVGMDNLDLQEIMSMGLVGGSGLSAKSAILQNLAYYGLIFVIVFVRYIYVLDKYFFNNKMYIFWGVGWYSVLSNLIFANNALTYDTLIVWGILWKLYCCKTNNWSY